MHLEINYDNFEKSIHGRILAILNYYTKYVHRFDYKSKENWIEYLW